MGPLPAQPRQARGQMKVSQLQLALLEEKAG